MRAILMILAALAICGLFAGCMSDTYNYHYAGHGHHGPGRDPSHYTEHYGSFGHPYGQHGFTE